MQSMLKTYDILFHVWEMAVSFLGLAPLALLQQEHTNRRRAAQRRTTREYTTQIQKVSAQIEARQSSPQVAHNPVKPARPKQSSGISQSAVTLHSVAAVG